MLLLLLLLLLWVEWSAEGGGCCCCCADVYDEPDEGARELALLLSTLVYCSGRVGGTVWSHWFEFHTVVLNLITLSSSL